MPDPGNIDELLKPLAEDTAERARELLKSGEISSKHLVEIVKLSQEVKYFQDPENLDSLLEDAEEMDLSAFRIWIEEMKKKHADS